MDSAPPGQRSQRPPRQVAPPELRNGRDGTARLGFAGFMTDVAGKQRQDSSIARRSISLALDPRRREAPWRNSRNMAPRPVISEPPEALISKRPAYLVSQLPLRNNPGSSAEFEVNHFQHAIEVKAARNARRAKRVEMSRAKAQVSGLEDWERTHLKSSASDAELQTAHASKVAQSAAESRRRESTAPGRPRRACVVAAVGERNRWGVVDVEPTLSYVEGGHFTLVDSSNMWGDTSPSLVGSRAQWQRRISPSSVSAEVGGCGSNSLERVP